MNNIEYYQNILETIKENNTIREYLKTALATNKSRYEKLEIELTNALKAREVINTVAKQTQQTLEVNITAIVSMALSAVFPDPYQFILRFEERRNQTEADLLLSKNGEEYNPLDAAGGGVLDVVAFALRVAVMNMQQCRKIIILDEPFKHLSSDLQPKASEMIKMLSEKLGIQFIIVSHEDGIIDCADKTFCIHKGALTNGS